MTTHQLEKMDFFDVKLLTNKKGVLYVRNGEIFIYHGKDKIKIDPDNVFVSHNQQPMTCLNANKDVTHEGHFYFWQKDDKYILNFISNQTYYLIKGGNATDSL